MKKLLNLVLVLCMVFTAAPYAVRADGSATATPTSSSVLVNGKTVAFDAYNINGNNYFKLRDLACALSGTAKQFDVGYDGVNNAITLTSGKAYTAVGGEMTVGVAVSKTAVPTSSKIYLDGGEAVFTAYNIGGNNYFKLRDIGETFGFGVDWDASTNTIALSTGEAYAADMLPVPATEESTTANVYGNTPGNIVNGGYVAVQGDWIYYCNVTDNHNFYKVRTDGSGKQMLSYDKPYFINVIGDWVYYSDVSDALRIHKIKTDGSGREVLTRSAVLAYVHVIGERIYYINAEAAGGDRIFSMGLDGGDVRKLNDCHSNHMNISGDWIYFTQTDGQAGGSLYRMRTDGTGTEEILGELISFPNVIGDKIYYVNETDGNRIYVTDADGSSGTKQKLCDDAAQCLNVDDGWVYYCNVDDGWKVYRIRTDGSGRQRLNDVRSINIFTSAERVYYCVELGLNESTGYYETAFYTMNKDGSDNRLVD